MPSKPLLSFLKMNQAGEGQSWWTLTQVPRWSHTVGWRTPTPQPVSPGPQQRGCTGRGGRGGGWVGGSQGVPQTPPALPCALLVPSGHRPILFLKPVREEVSVCSCCRQGQWGTGLLTQGPEAKQGQRVRWAQHQPASSSRGPWSVLGRHRWPCRQDGLWWPWGPRPEPAGHAHSRTASC